MFNIVIFIIIIKMKVVKFMIHIKERISKRVKSYNIDNHYTYITNLFHNVDFHITVIFTKNYEKNIHHIKVKTRKNRYGRHNI